MPEATVSEWMTVPVLRIVPVLPMLPPDPKEIPLPEVPRIVPELVTVSAPLVES
jgi:hypothetical protein